MIKVQRTGRLAPRISSPYLSSHPNLFSKLKAYETVSIPEEELGTIGDVKIVHEIVKPKKAKSYSDLEEKLEQE